MDLWELATMCLFMHNSAALYDEKLPAGCGYNMTHRAHMKCNAVGHSQQPSNNLYAPPKWKNAFSGIPTSAHHCLPGLNSL